MCSPRGSTAKREKGSSTPFLMASIHEAARCFIHPERYDRQGEGNHPHRLGRARATSPLPRRLYVASTFFGNTTERLYDVGVAGIHRLFQNMDLLKKARVIIVAAGMEGRPPVHRGGHRGRARHRRPDEHRLRREPRRLFRPSLHAQLLFDRSYLQHRQRLRRGLFRHPGQPPMKVLYLDPVLGISGDMTISALIDAGCPLRPCSWSCSGSFPWTCPP